MRNVFGGLPNQINTMTISNEEVQMFTYQHIREDENTLYGFLSAAEKDLFIKLIQKARALSSMYTLAQIVNIECEELDIRGYKHEGYFAAITNFKSYYDANMKMIDYEATKYRLEAFLKKNDRFVIPGFYGSLPDGTVKVMTRGGSDITGSILARLLDADVYENWTDVSGILMADPRIVKNPKRIHTITYSELRELSYMGASVLHEEAIFPVKEKNIPIHILNTNHPEEGGTIIVEEDDSKSKQVITGIAGKKNFTVVAIYKNHMSDEVGIIRRALEVFEHYRISIEHIPSGIDSFSIVVNTEDVKDVIYDIVGDIKRACNADSVKVIDGISLIATVGRHMMYRPGISGQLFATLGRNDINIRMIAQGSDEINIVVGVEDKDFEKTIKAIYEEFVVE